MTPFMETFRFKSFEVYEDAKKFRKLVKGLLKKFPFHSRSLVDQIERACLSIVLNIAEGSAKRSDKDFARFLEISVSSINEVIAGFDLACDDGLISKEEFLLIEVAAESIAKQLRGFIKKLLACSTSKLTVKSQRSIVRDFVA